MAECAIARCVQERRSFKRELQKWGKNVLFLAGLERVAEELVGQDKWKRLMEPIKDMEGKKCVDWEPDDTCCFCNSRKQLPPDPAKGICSIDSLGLNNDINESDGNLSESIFYNSPFLPWYFREGNASPSPSPDEPLDLSMGSKTATIGSCASPHSPSIDNDASTTVLKVPQIPTKTGIKKRFEASGCKKSYTEDELQAALRDIQSGKLGTRRAAVIYGIPRSTLRNKVYKMALERDANGAPSIRVSDRSRKESHGASRANGALDCSASASASESLRQLLRNRMADKSTEVNAKVGEGEGEGDKAKASQQDYGQTLGPLLTQVLANVHELALSKFRSGSAISSAMNASSNDDLCLPLLPDLIRRLVEERFEEERETMNASSKKNKCNTRNEEQTNSSNTSNVILKIPSYKPMKNVNEGTPTSSNSSNSSNGNGSSGASHTNSGNHTAGKGIGVSLREIIAKSISQRAAAANRSSDNEKLTPMAELLNGSSDSSNQEEPPSKRWKNPPQNKNSNSNTTQGAKAEKRTRPKRGRYRNYDRDNLAEAVRAVQRGEMSVHRAGSYYGVPHSTLEYKVKERHLLRPRKRDVKIHKETSGGGESKPNGTTNGVQNGKTNNNNNNNNNSTSATAEQKLSSLASAAGLSGLSFPAHIPIWQSSPFFSLDFNQFSPNHFFASQMMRKLQEDALMNADKTCSSSSSKEGMSLLNSIIRASVQNNDTPSSKKAAVDKTKDSPTSSD
uniref:HTH psq-type domain-containing protein n=1 Tax=Strigamia maritima TaxID=126957 RepID=T1IIW1_STRMM